MSAWGSTAPSNFQKIKKVQNQGLRLITGSLRSTPIAAMESVTGLQSLEQRRHENPHTAVQIHISKKSPNALE